MLARQLLNIVLILMLATSPLNYVIASAHDGSGDMLGHCQQMSDRLDSTAGQQGMVHHNSDGDNSPHESCNEDCSLCGSCANGSMLVTDQYVSHLTVDTVIDKSISQILAFQPDLNLRPPI